MRQRARSVADLHEDWLTQVETEGPFIGLPVVKDIWPDGVDRLGEADDRMTTFKQAFVTWQHEVDSYAYADRTPEVRERYAAVTCAWIDTVLDDLAGWEGLRIPGAQLPATLEIRSPGEQVVVRPSGALKGRDGDFGALLLVAEPTTSLRDTGLDGWAANEIDRMAMLLRKAQVEVGIVTDGQWWAIVWAKEGKPTGSGMVNALTWAEEPLLRDAFLTLVDRRRFRAQDAAQRLPRLFERSELEAEEITEALGTQVRRSVELLVQAFSEARLAAMRNGDPDPLPEDPDEVYQAAVTVMMRVVFLLFAEEREMLPTEQLYWDSYAIRDLLADLKGAAISGEEPLDESFDVWHRLLAVSQALYAGVNYDEMRMPAYGGSLLDPERFPWLSATDRRGLRLKVSDRVMLHVLQSVQTVVMRRERRRVSFRDIDVEQIGYVYESLLGYSCDFVADQVVIGLVGKEGEEPEIDADTLQHLYDETSDAKTFASGLIEWIKEHQPAAKPLSPTQLAKRYDAEIDEAEMRRLLTPAAGHDGDLLDFLIDWSNYIRRDLRGIPLIVPVGGLVVVETPSRKNAGAHYTPRFLAKEVVRHALEPLVYEPGPLQTNDENAWRLKSSSEILELKVADIAAGSGAFLVGAARYLADRVTEAWKTEARLASQQVAEPQLAKDRAIREVIARCLYGADINPMAVEMCKLSLWLVSMDKTTPFSFVDDKIFCGNSLLGVTSLEQLRQLHIYPQQDNRQGQLLVDVDAKIAEATRCREELASPVDEHDPMRSTRGKRALLEQLRKATADLRLIADGVIAAGLPFGGKNGSNLNRAYMVLNWEAMEAFPPDGSEGDPARLKSRINAGLTPTAEADVARWVPLHWAIEAPEVIVQRGGFDAIIGNPPFLVAKKISGAVGRNVREWCASVIGRGVTGKADLVAYFLRRSSQLASSHSGGLGLVLAKAVAEGSTRVVALDPLVAEGWTIHRAIRSATWPTSAQTLISKVWMTRQEVRAAVVSEGLHVEAISSTLDTRNDFGLPRPIRHELRPSLGSALQGEGFLVSEEEARRLVEEPRNREVVRPYLNASGSSNVPPRFERWVIDFREMPEAQARAFVEPFAIVEMRVLPERRRKDEIKYPRMVYQWWKHWNSRPELYPEIRRLPRVIALPVVSKHCVPIMVDPQWVLSSALVVFPSDDDFLFGVLSSSWHRVWLAQWGSKMKTDFRYSTRDVWSTFPLPEETNKIRDAGRSLRLNRDKIAEEMQGGITMVYNGIDDVSNLDPRMQGLRELIRKLDEAVSSAYGSGIRLDHGHSKFREVSRYWFMSEARSQALSWLLAENHRRHVAQDLGLGR